MSESRRNVPSVSLLTARRFAEQLTPQVCSPTGSLDVTLSGGSSVNSPISNRSPIDSAYGDNLLGDRPTSPTNSFPSPTVDPRTLFGGHPASPGYYTLGPQAYTSQLQFWEPTPADVEEYLNIHSPVSCLHPPPVSTAIPRLDRVD